MKKLKVTAFTVVYNEEKRIEKLLKSLMWADEIIVYDKHSTDLTVQLAQKYTDRIIKIPFSDGGATAVFNVLDDSKNEWLYTTTAAGLIHPQLIEEVGKLIGDSNFTYDVIEVPYKIYSFGIHSPHSPWYDSHKPKFIKKVALEPSHELHREISFKKENVYQMPWINDEAVCYHLTHWDMNDFSEKVIRYTRYEANYFIENDRSPALKRNLFEVVKAIGVAILKRRVFMIGWDGVALGLGYVSYFIMKFLFVWDSRRQNGNVVYPKIQEMLSREWDKYNFEKDKN